MYSDIFLYCSLTPLYLFDRGHLPSEASVDGIMWTFLSPRGLCLLLSD